MGEAVTLAAAVVSSIAAAVGTMVSVAEYRRSRERERGPTTTPPPSPQPATTVTAPARPRSRTPSAPQPPEPAPASTRSAGAEPARRERTIRRAVVVVTIACLLAAICQFAYWSQYDKYSYEAGSDALVGVTGFGSLVASAVGVIYAVRVAVGGVRGRRWREVRIAGLVLLGALVPWTVAVLQAVIDTHLRGS
jgi:uncharacterized membrane protein